MLYKIIEKSELFKKIVTANRLEKLVKIFVVLVVKSESFLLTLVLNFYFSAELALDRGVLLGGNREQALCEVEVELKSGTDAAAIVLAQALAARYDLKSESKSKFRRAMNLAAGE